MKQLFIRFILCYQRFVSPVIKQLIGVNSFCKYSQTCSEYAKQSITKYGVVQGGALAIKRIMSCQSLVKSFYKIESLKIQ